MDTPSQNNTPAYLKSLNGPQRQGVLATDGPVLVIAGAGSGKTKMLTSRIVHLIEEKGAAPDSILAVTFTNKAAGEMRERVMAGLGLPENAWRPVPFWAEALGGARNLSAQPTIGTFHSTCIRILRREIDRLPYKGQFQVLDDGDQLTLVKECFQKLNLSDKMFSPKSFQWAINEAKCAAKEPADLELNEYDVFGRNLAKVYAMYQEEMFKNGSIDFGEIITLTYKLFRDNPDVLAKYQEKYQYIHVDEYQDTNKAQYLVVTQLAAAHRNLCVVGDEDQSIYRWRGADIRNILDFEKDYPEAKVIKLEQNYRSTQTIIEASSALIANNTTRKNKKLWTDNEVGAKIQKVQVADEQQEAQFVVRALKAHCEEDEFSYRDVAIFYRTNAQSRVFEDVLRREKVPYTIVGGLKFYDRKEIKDVMAYLRVLANASDSVCAKRIINVPQRGIGKTTVEKIEQVQFQQGITFLDAIQLSCQNGILTGAAARKATDFLNLVNELRARMQEMALADFYHEILDRTGYVSELRLENTEESFARIENLQEFESIIAEFHGTQKEFAESVGHSLSAAEALPAFLESVTLASETKDEDENGTTGVVSLMTLHTSKGLEFPVVFMVGCEEGLFPSIRSDEEPDPEEIEEERRLCYVGMTRAKQALYMTHAACRRIYGNLMYQEPSRFFEEIPAQYVDTQDLAPRRQSLGGGMSYEYDEDDVPSYGGSSKNYNNKPTPGRAPYGGPRPVSASAGAASPGMVGRKVKHPVYGTGTIKASEGLGTDMKVTIEFKSGMKKFVLKFAQLEFLS